MYETMERFFQGDGWVWVVPIVIIFALGLAIAVERYVYITVARTNNRRMMGRLMPVLQKGDYKQAYSLASKSNHAISRMLAQGLSRYKSANGRDDIEAAMEESMLETIPRLEKRTHYLATFANIATLLGLLGTIMGLIDAFNSITAADAATKAAKLSDSISLAMITTAMGLIVAIPLLLMHAVLQTKTTEIVDSLEMATVKFVNMMMQRKSISKPS